MAFLLIIPKFARGDAGFGAAAKTHRFFLNKPFALNRDDDFPKADGLFIGLPVCELITLVPDGIDFAEGISRVNNVKNFGVYGDSVCFGETWDNKWYIGFIDPFISTKVFDKEDDWRAELSKHSVPGSFTLLTFDQGYKKVNRDNFLWLSFWFFGYLIFFSIPWAIYTYIKAGHHKLEIEEIKKKMYPKNESEKV